LANLKEQMKLVTVRHNCVDHKENKVTNQSKMETIDDHYYY
jgi:hypothetical protein